MRPTWPRSAAKTPSWQVTEDSTRIVVLTVANGTLSFAVSCGPQVRADRADREVGREQRREEHQLAGEPDDGADADHARTVVVPVQPGGRDRCCCRHARHYVVTRSGGHPDPLCFGVIKFTACCVPPSLTASDAVADLPRFTLGRSSPSGRCDPVPVRADRLGGRALPARRAGACAAAATTGRSGRTLVVRGGRDGRRSTSRPSSGLAAYDTTLLSVHMVQHMLLSMLVPLCARAGRAGDARAAHAAAAAAALAARACCTRGSRRC